jgi:Hint-domain
VFACEALITEYLGIPMECYDNSDPCTVFTIVNESGKKAGFATFVEEMMRRLVDAGACFYPFHELKSLARTNDGGGANITELHFANGVVATANVTTILNMPQKPLFAVIRNSRFDDNGLLDAPTLDALHSVQSVIATKLYLYYPRGQVFWRKLGLIAGDYEFAGDARNMLLGGRYHGKQYFFLCNNLAVRKQNLTLSVARTSDGQVECEDDDDLDTCHGFLLAVYVNDLSGNKAQFFRRYQRERPEPVTIISNTDLEGAEFLKHAHSRLEEFHLYNNPNATYTGSQAQTVFSETNPPEFAVLSTWNTDIPWAGGAWHQWTDLDNVETAMQPFVDHNIFVINEAYSLLHGWAEGSLKLGDEVLETYFGISRPWSFAVTDIVQTVAQTNSRECLGVSSNSTSSGSGGGESTGNGSGGGSVLCFSGDALVEMADGNFKEISSLKAGDLVATGIQKSVGLVTEVLVHSVESVIPVVVLTTDHGELVGTPSHPIFHQNQWIELEELTSENLTLESRYIDVLYNLEIDGHLMDESPHSYVVNGVVASGLGDNEGLNRRFPRQNVWKELVAEK